MNSRCHEAAYFEHWIGMQSIPLRVSGDLPVFFWIIKPPLFCRR